MSSIDKPSGWWPWTRSIRSSAHGEPAIPWLASPPTSTAPQTGAAVSTPSVQSIVSTPIPPLESETLRPVIANISSPAQPASDTAVTASTAFMQYNKYILGAASIAAFSSMIYTIRQRTKGKMKIPLQELLDNPAAAAANPKLAAYMFAGRAFGTATVLVVTGTVGLAMTVASVMGINNLKEFSVRMRDIMASRFPQLKRSDEKLEEKFDPATYEFLKEVAEDAEREEAEGEWKEGPGHAIIGNRVRHEMGPLSRHGMN